MSNSLGRSVMRHLNRGAQSRGWGGSSGWISGVALLLWIGTAAAQEAPAPQERPKDRATVESLYTDFVHYAKLGRFTAADAFAKSLLEHPDLTPTGLLTIAERNPEDMETLIILVANSTVGERAAEVLDLIREGQYERRKDPEQIRKNVEALGGTPQQEYEALSHLVESGEYAVPWLLATLSDSTRQSLSPRIIHALPKLGSPAVRPLTAALSIKNPSVRLNVIEALGELGYPEAVPFLQREGANNGNPPEVLKAANAAIARIATRSGRPAVGTAVEGFYALADRYYRQQANDDVVLADDRLPMANVWYWDDANQGLKALAVPSKIFGAVMAMRCCEEALLLKPDMADAVALWLSSNIRREARLGFDVESGDPSQSGEADATRPANYPRALYFTSAAGPRYALLVLARAVADKDAAVALGAIRSLRLTAGPSSLLGAEGDHQVWLGALQFPDPMVRIRAALALGAATPTQNFSGAEWVITTLEEAIGQPSGSSWVLIAESQESLNRLRGAVPKGSVIGEAEFYKGLNRARSETANVDAFVLASAIAEPDLATAMRQLREEFRFARTPVVLVADPAQDLLVEQITRNDPYARALPSALADAAAIQGRVDEIKTGQMKMNATLSTALALEAAEVLRGLAVDGRSTLPYRLAEGTLIGGLQSSDERIQVACANVLARLESSASQRALAGVASDAAQTQSLRVACFGALGESARLFGNQLEPDQVSRLVEIARTESDLILRTAAGQVLGAVNLADNQASTIIRSHYRG